MHYMHKQTGSSYWVIDDWVLEASDGRRMVLYQNKEAQKFVREAKEFFEKFEMEEKA